MQQRQHVGAVVEARGPRGSVRTRWLRTVERGLVLFFTAVVSLVAVAGGLMVTLHLTASPVLTASMQPTFGPGAAVITRDVPTDTLRPGDVIAFTPPGQQNVYVHRIASISGPPGRPVITTRGDANRADDPWHARIVSRTTPVVLFAIPWVGNFLLVLQQRMERTLILGSLALTMAIAAAQLFFPPFRRQPVHRPGLVVLRQPTTSP
jgi:signal peptidase I